MKIDFDDIAATITAQIKTNGKRFITATQLKDILTTILGNPDELQLKYGNAVNRIYDGSGTISTAARANTLMTLSAFYKLSGGSANSTPAVFKPTLWLNAACHIDNTNLIGTIITKRDSVELGDLVLLAGQSDPAENGVYEVFEGYLEKSTLYPDAASLDGTIVISMTGSLGIVLADDAGHLSVTDVTQGIKDEIIGLRSDVNTLGSLVFGVPLRLKSTTYYSSTQISSQIFETPDGYHNIEKRYKYYPQDTNGGSIELMEITTVRFGLVLFMRVRYNYVNGLLDSTTHETTPYGFTITI